MKKSIKSIKHVPRKQNNARDVPGHPTPCQDFYGACDSANMARLGYSAH